jgi:molybdopterin-guanine dinucleotide biosynthesis protein A
MSARQVTAVVLAGGRSSRFGSDKLVEPIDGRPLLSYAIEAVRPFSTEILVVVAPGAAPFAALPEGVTLVHDTVAFEGPLAGLLAGLTVAREPIVLVVGGDMPTLVGSILEAMLAELDAPPEAPAAPDGVQAVVLEHEGHVRPLPMVVHRTSALAVADQLIGAGERRLRAVTDTLTTRVIPESTWRAIDPDGLTLRDIDTQADLV